MTALDDTADIDAHGAAMCHRCFNILLETLFVYDQAREVSIHKKESSSIRYIIQQYSTYFVVVPYKFSYSLTVRRQG